jgi:hypothetical protein
MFPAGLEPDRIARLEALVTQCRPVLESEGGMDAVQQLLGDRDVSPMDTALVTAELPGGDAAAYRATKRIVLLHPSRVDLLDWHKDLMSTVDDLNQGA